MTMSSRREAKPKERRDMGDKVFLFFKRKRIGAEKSMRVYVALDINRPMPRSPLKRSSIPLEHQMEKKEKRKEIKWLV